MKRKVKVKKRRSLMKKEEPEQPDPTEPEMEPSDSAGPAVIEVLCDCGAPVSLGGTQCWTCAHRS
jgi:hypothetical protein